jgi:hypothetical protein
MTVWAQNASQYVFSKYLYANNNTKCISTCVDQKPPFPALTESPSQHMFNKPSPTSEDTKCISAHDDENHPLPAKTQIVTQPIKKRTKFISTWVAQTSHTSTITQIVSQHLLTKHYHANEGTKYIETSHTSEDTECVSTRVDQATSLPPNTQN